MNDNYEFEVEYENPKNKKEYMFFGNNVVKAMNFAKNHSSNKNEDCFLYVLKKGTRSLIKCVKYSQGEVVSD